MDSITSWEQIPAFKDEAEEAKRSYGVEMRTVVAASDDD